MGDGGKDSVGASGSGRSRPNENLLVSVSLGRTVPRASEVVDKLSWAKALSSRIHQFTFGAFAKKGSAAHYNAPRGYDI